MTETISIIPKPVTLEPGEGHFILNAGTALVADIEEAPLAEQLAARLRPATGFNLPVVTGSQAAAREVIDRCPTGAIVWLDAKQGAIKGGAAKKIVRLGAKREAPT